MTTRKEFIERVEKLSAKIDVEYKKIHFRHKKKKWASCSTRGRFYTD